MDPIRYISTRGKQTPLTFKDAVMTGLARDGGLLIPNRIPRVADQLADWRELDYPNLAFEIIRLPSRLVESTIAASIIVAALANLWPVRRRVADPADLYVPPAFNRWLVPWKVAFV